MAEFFVHGRTFAAPFVSEDITRYIEATEPGAALEALAAELHDGVGLFAGNAYASADDFHKDRPALARWLSNKALAIQGASSVYSESPGRATLDGDREIVIEDPKGGRVVAG